MNLELLLSAPDSPAIRFALTGAGGGFGRTLLAQARRMSSLRPAALCDLDPDAAIALCVELGYDRSSLVRADDAAAVAAAPPGSTVVVPDAALLPHADHDVLVEATGSPAAGFRAARDALTAGRDVAMVSKEVDSVAGVHLADLAAAHGAVYTPAAGDQPANLLALLSWARVLELEVVAAGKSSEYDVVVDEPAGTVSYLDTTVAAPALREHLVLGEDVRATLDARAAAVAELGLGAAADPCEMGVVANHGGLPPDAERMHYPVVRINELAEVYVPREDGGILGDTGVVDVFAALRRPDEASFAGGVFIVVRTHDPKTWRTLEAKGHVVSRNGRYACLYLPYHVMGVETPTSLLAAARLRIPAGSRHPRQTAVLAGRANRPLEAGAELRMGGHFHEIDGVDAVLLRGESTSDDVVPYYLAAHGRLVRPVASGELLTFADVAGIDPELRAAYEAGRALPAGTEAAR